MSHTIQGACVVAIAIGAGLYAFGNSYQPRVDLADPAEAVRFFKEQSDERLVASAARGCGTGFMTLGGLGLVVPWVNALITSRKISN